MTPYEWLVDQLILQDESSGVPKSLQPQQNGRGTIRSEHERFVAGASSTLRGELERAIAIWNDVVEELPAPQVLQHDLVQALDKSTTAVRLRPICQLSELEMKRWKMREGRPRSGSPCRRRPPRKHSWPRETVVEPTDDAVWVELPPLNPETLSPAWYMSDERLHLMETCPSEGIDMSSSRPASWRGRSHTRTDQPWFSRPQASKLAALFMDDKEAASSRGGTSSASSAHNLMEEFEVDHRFCVGEPLPVSSDEDGLGSNATSSPRTLAPWNTSLSGTRDVPVEDDAWARLTLYLPPYHAEETEASAGAWGTFSNRCKYNVRVLRDATVSNVLEGLREILRRVIARAGDPNLALMLACVWELHPAVEDVSSEGLYFEKKPQLRRLIRRPDLDVPPLELSMTVSDIVRAGTVDFAVSVVDTPSLPAGGHQTPAQPFIDRDVYRYVASLHRKIGISGVHGSPMIRESASDSGSSPPTLPSPAAKLQEG
eukprot:Gregarina_sp_Poly_1__9231@NODE_56_length_17373_cov_108_729111_g48_i0_p5_GENE_NODE_56_length_17373_cov_108_729111_g48_i0NODE_56_length_17373_cov_108_729111_g48_i0_p5_ORF_typecomplete_len486_score65_53SeqA_N/PF17206_3/2_9e03SeqA_N/PF17206_3/1_8e04SeqA_N/PF17206_3/0_15SeqA_N/PF17206_3/7_7e02_NODE_56_length_17373_cov_108_729111_g48_i01273514192